MFNYFTKTTYKTLTEFSRNPDEYLERSGRNFEIMPPQRKQKIVTNALITTAVATVSTTGIAVLSGSNRFSASFSGVTLGLACGLIHGFVQAHNYSTLQRVVDKIKLE